MAEERRRAESDGDPEDRREREAPRDDFAERVRDALAHLYDPAYLQTHPLTRYLQADSGARKPILGRALRQALLEAIEALHPGGEGNPGLTRHSTILQLRYVEGLDAREVESRLAISRSQFYREHQIALEAVTSILRSRWGLDERRGEGGGEKAPRPEPESEIPVEQPRHNLPLQLTSFVGRERERGEVTQLLGTTRLLTLTGTGGCGKTRLAYQVAELLVREHGEDCRDGVWAVELAALSDPELVPQAVASALGLREASGAPILDTLLAYLKTRRCLLVLDNCEHLLDACASLVERLLTACPHLRVLATSREILSAGGEVAWRVPSLAAPDPRDLPPLDRLVEHEAVRLFVERARAVQPSFQVTDQNAAALAEICARLDGIPLALELAAARVRGLTVEQIATRLGDRFGLLTGGRRTALRRQQTLRAAIDWSHDLLSPPERALFRRLAVFAGGFTVEAAEAVCEGGEGDKPRIARDDILEPLLHLVDRSLVVAEEAAGAERYRLLETIRQYAQEKLRDADEDVTVRDRHRDWYGGLVERAEPELIGPSEGEWLDRLEREHDNLRAVLEWCLVGEPEAGLRVAGGLWWFWSVRSYYTEALRWLEDLLQRAPEPTALRAKALVGVGSLSQYQSDQSRCWSALEESLEISRSLGDDTELALGLAEVGMRTFNRGEYARGFALLEESLAAARRADLPPTRTLWALNRLGVAAHLAGDLLRAKAILEEGLILARQVGSKRHLGWALGDLGQLLASLGEYTRAKPLLEEGVAVSREVGDRQGLPWRLLHLGNLLSVQNEHRRSRELLEEARERFWSLEGDDWKGLLLASLASLERSEGRYDQARGCLEESFDASLTVQDVRNMSHRVWLWGVLEAEHGAHARGTRLIGAGLVHGLYQTLLYPIDREESDAALDQARAALGEEAFTLAWAEGQAMTLDQAVEYALRDEE